MLRLRRLNRVAGEEQVPRGIAPSRHLRCYLIRVELQERWAIRLSSNVVQFVQVQHEVHHSTRLRELRGADNLVEQVVPTVMPLCAAVVLITFDGNPPVLKVLKLPRLCNGSLCRLDVMMSAPRRFMDSQMPSSTGKKCDLGIAAVLPLDESRLRDSG